MSFTPEQEDSAKRILELSKVDLYETLSLTKSCTDAEIKKSYRKLALKFHPDKNSAPSAEAAFLALNFAMSILQDPPARQRYDSLGHATTMKIHRQGPDNGTSNNTAQSACWPKNWPKHISVERLLKEIFKDEKILSRSSIRKSSNPIIKPTQFRLWVLAPACMLYILFYISMCFFNIGEPIRLEDSYRVSYPSQPYGKFQEMHWTYLSGDSLRSPYHTIRGFNAMFPATNAFEKSIDVRYRELMARSCGSYLLQQQRTAVIKMLSSNDTASPSLPADIANACLQFQDHFLRRKD